MMLKFGGLLECAEKATVCTSEFVYVALYFDCIFKIIGELGRLLIDVRRLSLATSADAYFSM